MRLTFFCLLFSIICCFAAYAQHDSLTSKDKNVLNPVDPTTVNPFLPDSIVKQNRVKFIQDSIATFYLIPDSARGSRLMDSVLKGNLYKVLLQPETHPAKRSFVPTGRPRSLHDPWIIAVVLGLLIYTGLLNLFLGSDIRAVIQSFYNKHALSQTDKEGGLINSWAFLGLFLLFSLSLGLVLYQLSQYYGVSYSMHGFQVFVTFSVAVILLLALKFIILKFVGFVFDMDSLVSEYLAVLNLTYFNMGFVLLGVGICFSLLSNQFVPVLLTFTLGAVALIFVWQYLRNSVSIISDFRFHKFYLFIYLCALEICPVLILIKALNI
jgi:hypothetical protein